jgi:16S rRNA (guanine527-N7)-methyltransferase
MTALPRDADLVTIIRQGSLLLGISLDDGTINKMLRHLSLIGEWRSRVNLTSVTDARDIAIRHFLDSLTVFKVIPIGRNLRVLDIGTGAGFPGMVLQTVDDSLEVTLMDRDPRKIVFLKHVARELALDRLKFLNAPLSALLDDVPVRRFDLVISRAFSSDPLLLDRLSVALTRTGSLVRMTGPSSLTAELLLRNFRQTAMWEGTLPFSSRFRRVIHYARIA